jgi:hypothetical protein
VAKRSTPRRGRSSRKRRQTAPAEGAGHVTATAVREGDRDRAGGRTVASASAGAGGRGPRRVRRDAPDERPQAPWHPLPLSELLIFVGIIGAVIGASRGESGLPALLAGVGAVTVGTLEFTIREHRAGFRSHASLLAALPTALLHGALAVGLLALHAPSPSWVLVPVLVDVPVFLVLYRALRRRFQDARRERMFTGR